VCTVLDTMHVRSPLLAPVSLLALIAACSSGAAPPPVGNDAGKTGSGTGTSAGSGSGSSVKGSGSGTGTVDSGVSFPVAITYAPKGCSYQVEPPAKLAYTGAVLDDTTSAGPAATAAPIRVRLGLGGNTTEGAAGYADPTTTAAFTWETGAANHAARVKLGTSATALTTVQSGYSWTVPATLLGSAVYLHEVHVCGLTPATTYYYQVGGGAPGQEIWSATQSFTTVPATGAITVGISGDARDTVGTWQLLNQRMKTLGVSAHLFTGDIVLTGSDESLYTTWLDAIWDPTAPDGGPSTGPFLTLGEQLFIPVAGNHEAESSVFFANFAVPGSGQYAKTFGSYNIGAGHFVFIDDAHIAAVVAGSDDPEADAQVAWLNQDLAAANADRANHPFIFVLSHRGLFSTSNHQSDSDVLEARSTLAPIFAKYSVDAVFNGHDHEYERTQPIVPGSPVTGAPTVASGTTQGTVYVICAGAGAQPYSVSPGTVAWRANQIPFGSAAASGSAQAGYVGIYQTLTLTPKSGTSPATALLNVYPLIPGGGDTTPIDTLTLKH